MNEPQSFWMTSTPLGHTYEPLQGDLRTTVAIVGGGIAGVTTALLLKRAGVDVVVLEADRVGSGVTGHTTGKLTAGQGLAYSRIAEQHGADSARIYADSQSAAVELVFDLVHELGVDCDLERVSDYVFAETAEEADLLEAELEASRAAGVARVLERGRGQPVRTSIAALHLERQGQFHARKYVLGLAQVAHGDSCRVFESTRVLDVEPGTAHAVTTENGVVHADHVVLATNAPITSKGLFFTRVHPWRSYAVAAPVAKDTLAGSWINAGSPVRSLRTTALAGNDRLLIVVGEGHRVGQTDDTRERYRALTMYLERNFPEASPRYRWSTQDQFAVDGLPYIGRVGAIDSRLYVATGFGGWGLTNGTLAGLIVRDAILGRSNAWEELFDPNRSSLSSAPGALLRENANVAKQLIGGRLRGRDGEISDVLPGTGVVLDLTEGKAAVYRDDDGAAHVVSATCTHMGCLVEWNEAERSWDCPCHGSRFDTDGTVLAGPATHPLGAIYLPVEARSA